ncbi:long-chain fatty acid--CoA ligase [Ramlibacter sp. G-1-2-2]|uniref:Long-chain fatty acid--CoA ligase n=1 Tax=Ramlibacter agri TaxID=2728837 RepID=A0A848H8R8_9BURK|nr:long-chain fatty acid--CoA ligase [Ramlibacter agri]NML45861.1 long-chain fatty acid--CoA ligase [Ramlibacter agri]
MQPSASTPRPETRHWPFWPPGQSRHLTLPQTHLFYNAEVAATRFPDKPFIVFYDNVLTFAEFRAQAERIAGFLQQDCGVQPGDRVLLDMQNSPQWVLAYYGILRADAVVVPVNPMNKTEELRHYMEDAGAKVAFVAQDLLPQMQPLVGADGLRRVIVATYGDHLQAATSLKVPDFVAAPRLPLQGEGLVAWTDMLAAACVPGPMRAGPDDLAVMPYTSGTTGQPKGCMHTHRSVMTTAVQGVQWFSRTQDWVALSVLPFFHVTGMAGGMNGPLYAGGTMVLLPRWDRDAAAECIQRYKVTTWQAITTMVIDMVSNPRITEYDLGSLIGIRGGGAAMPEAVAARLKSLTGLDFVEGYGMSETLAATHLNPTQQPKPQCLGIPMYDVDSRLIDPETLGAVPPGEPGEIVVHGPQVMQGYWRNAEATQQAFVEIEGKRFLRTGDLARVDEQGYFFMTDRLKRMVNASGFKVWPAEVEAMMHHHPAIQEACVIGARDPRRGETVKALVVLRAGLEKQPTPQDITDWCHEHMAAYKVPRIVEFVAALPRGGSGKVLWRELQEKENAK